MTNYRITDTQTPIIIVVGPAKSGKSMIMARLINYLHKKQRYIIEPDYTYLNTIKYFHDCADYTKCIHENHAMPGTDTDLLIQIKDASGTNIAQYIEAPGEAYFNPANPNAQPPVYLQHICGGDVPNKKVFIYLLNIDLNMGVYKPLGSYEAMRGLYADRLINVFKPLAQPKDKFILLYNKVDMTNYGTIYKIKNRQGAVKEARQNYPYVFSSLRKNVLGGLITYDDFKFLPFSAGWFVEDIDDEGNTTQSCIPSSDMYPQQLWKMIIRN